MARNPFDEITAGLQAFRKKYARKVTVKNDLQKNCAAEIIRWRDRSITGKIKCFPISLCAILAH